MKNFDDLLNETLKENAQAEPLAGLEQRILNRVQQGRERTHWRLGWSIAVATLAIAALIPLAIQRSTHREHSHITHAPVAVSPEMSSAQSAPLQQVRSDSNQLQRQIPRASASTKRHGVRREQREEPLPKLETFPAITQQRGRRGEGWEEVARSPEAVKALVELKDQQKQSIDIAAIEIKPL